MICTAKRTNGEPCRAKAIAGKTKCRVHGGHSPGGQSSPHFKTGRYSKYVPKHLADSFDQMVSDPARLDLSENIALIDTRTGELLSSIDHGGTQAHWAKVSDLATTLETMLNRKNYEKAQVTLTEIKEVCVSAIDDSKVWAEITALGENRRKLAETEHKRLLTSDMMIQADRAYSLISLIQDVILRNVSDPKTRNAIAHELGNILNPAIDQRVGSNPPLIDSVT